MAKVVAEGANELERVVFPSPAIGTRRSEPPYHLNEFLKEHCKVEKLEATVAQQQKESQSIATRQQKEVDAARALNQKVNDKVELNKPAPQTIADNQ
jgi:hypothetical protein